MTRYLGLDVSTKTGYAVIDIASPGDPPELQEYGLLKLPKKIDEYGPYPWSYVHAARAQVDQITALVARVQPDVVVVEETNLGRQRYSQKALEFLHNTLLVALEKFPESYERLTPPVFYLSSSKWRNVLGLKMSKEDTKNNKLVKKAAVLGIAKKEFGVKGAIKAKHLAVRFANEVFGLDLLMKDNDIADALCLCLAFIAGAAPCDGSDR